MTQVLSVVLKLYDYYNGAKTSGTVTAVDLDKVELYTQEENAKDVVLRTIASPAVNQALSTHIAAGEMLQDLLVETQLIVLKILR